MELGEFDQALAYAPAVSLEYWKIWMEKYGVWLSTHEERFSEAPLPYIAINEVDTAVQMLTEHEEYEDSKLIRALKIAGVYNDIKTRYEETKITEEPIDHHQDLKNKVNLNQDEQLIDLTKRQAEQYFKAGQAILSWCEFLSINDYKSALKQLIRANELFLAYVLAYLLFPEGLKDVIRRLVYRAERNMLIYEAKGLLNIINEDGIYVKSLMLLRLSKQGLISYDEFEEEKSHVMIKDKLSGDAQSLLDEVFSEKIESACEIWIKYFESILDEESFDNLFNWIQIFEIIQEVQISKITPSTKSKIFGYLSIIGICKAICYGFVLIIPGLLNWFIRSQVEIMMMKRFMESIEKSVNEKDKIVDKDILHKLEIYFEDDFNRTFYRKIFNAIDK